MSTRKKVIRACFAAVLAVGLAACGGGSDEMPEPGPTPIEMERGAVDGAIGAATAAIDGLTAMSSDADVAAAQMAIAAAQAALDGTTALPLTEARALQGRIAATRTALGAKQSEITGYRTHQSQHAAASSAVNAATTAVDALTAMSTDAELDAADSAVTAAASAIAAGTTLTDSETTALNGVLTLARANLTNKRTLVADQRARNQRSTQYTLVSDAISAATMAVGSLTPMSSEAEVATVQSAVDYAQAALAAATVLPATDVFALQRQIDAARASLVTARMAIADYATHQGQLADANSAVKAAEMAVGALTVTSEDAAVDAAVGAIAAAKAAVAAGTMLTDAEKTMLNGDISTAEGTLGTARMAINDYRTHMTQFSDANSAVEAAELAIAALTAMSTPAEVEAAQDALMEAERAVAAGTMLTATESAVLSGRIALARTNLATARTDISDQQMQDRQRAAATEAAEAAEGAVGGLTAMSSDADVMAAEGVIATARATLALTTALPANEILALKARIDAAEGNLGTTRMDIANYRTHGTQHRAAMDAVEKAQTAVDALTEMSEDADVMAAEGLIETAKAAVAAGTMLTADEMAMLNGDIETAEGALGTIRMDIANYRTHGTEYRAAMDAAAEATRLVGGLTAMSSDADVMEAEEAIKAAEMAVAVGTLLTEADKAALNGRIAIAKVDLGTARMDIAEYRMGQTLLSEARDAVGTAVTLVAGLTPMSNDTAVMVAEKAIEDAEAAVAEVTDESEATALTTRIATAKMDLGDVRTRIADYRALQTANKIVMLHREASMATKDAMAAHNAADQAVKDAKKYSEMLTVMSVKGDSYEAMMNAQKVLDARDDVAKAVTDAEAAKERAENAKTDAEAIAAGTDGKQGVIDALDDAIEKAEEEIAYTMGIRDAKNADDSINQDGVDLKSYVELVTGTDEDMPMTPTEKGEEVARAVGGALLPMVPDTVADATTHDGTARRVEHYNTTSALTGATPPAVGDRTSHAQDSSGMTWAMIIGEDSVVTERLGTISGSVLTTGNGLLSLAPIAGMDVEDVNPDASDLSTGGGTNSDGMYADLFSTDATDINYKGIPGVVVCLGSDGCSVGTSGTNEGKLVGGWYFTPTMPTALYIEDSADAMRYAAATLYVEWGHWLTVDSSTGNVTIHTYATSGGNTSDLDLGVVAGTVGEDETARYTGGAAGMSLHKTFDDDGDEETIHSGAFTADVTLTAKFGSAPTLEGMISGFQSTSGMNIDSGWEVKLQETGLTSAATFTGGGVAKGSGQAGDWSTQGYGSAPIDHDSDSATPAQNQRPAGFFGNFEAHFTDGHAAGAYAAQEE